MNVRFSAGSMSKDGLEDATSGMAQGGWGFFWGGGGSPRKSSEILNKKKGSKTSKINIAQYSLQLRAL